MQLFNLIAELYTGARLSEQLNQFIYKPNFIEISRVAVVTVGEVNLQVVTLSTPVSYTHLRAHETEADLVEQLKQTNTQVVIAD